MTGVQTCALPILQYGGSCIAAGLSRLFRQRRRFSAPGAGANLRDDAAASGILVVQRRLLGDGDGSGGNGAAGIPDAQATAWRGTSAGALICLLSGYQRRRDTVDKIDTKCYKI